MKTEILGLTQEELADLLQPYGFQKFRAQQIAQWIYKKGMYHFEEMTNLSRQQRQVLVDNFTLSAPQVLRQWDSQDGETTKWVLGLEDGLSVEAVLMRHDYGNSVCISTQVGCAMGCVFCASTLEGVQRNLTCGEIYAQVRHIQNYLEKEQKKINTIVIMGSGEPLMNYDNVLNFVRLCHTDYALNLGYRHITLSTSGITPKILQLANENIPLNLSLSLHAPNSTLRAKLMPIENRYPLKEVLEALDVYAEKSNRRLTFEYILIAGVNDRYEHMSELAELIKGRLAVVNLIPINSVPERGLLRPSAEQIKQFEEGLKKRKIAVTVRREMGSDIKAACGQLRYQILQEQKTR